MNRWLLAVCLVAASGCRLPWQPAPLVIAFGETRISLDPHLTNRNVAWSVLASICDPLVEFSPELVVRPALAERWEQPDETSWRFDVRDGVLFSDGSPLTAADIVASLDRARNLPRSAVSYYLTGVRSVRADGDHTVVIETSDPVPDLLNRLTFVLVVPRSQAAQPAISAPIGTGSYRFVRMDAEGTVVAQARSGWRGRPEIAEVHFEFCGSDEEAARRLASSHADIAHHLPDDWVSEVEIGRSLRLIEQPRLAVQLIGIHPDLAPTEVGGALADRRVRAALLLALDRSAWIRRIFHGNGAVATQYVHPAVTGFDPELTSMPHDPAEARRLLAEAGFPSGFAVSMAAGGSTEELIATIVSDLENVGVTVTPVATGANQPLALFSWSCSTGDASDFLNSPIWRRQTTSRGAPAADPTCDRALELAAAADHETDPARRLELLHQAQRAVIEELPLLPLTIRWGYKGVSDRVDVVTRYDERELPASFRWRQDARKP